MNSNELTPSLSRARQFVRYAALMLHRKRRRYTFTPIAVDQTEAHNESQVDLTRSRSRRSSLRGYSARSS